MIPALFPSVAYENDVGDMKDRKTRGVKALSGVRARTAARHVLAAARVGRCRTKA